jgi:hypothetical protein
MLSAFCVYYVFRHKERPDLHVMEFFFTNQPP